MPRLQENTTKSNDDTDVWNYGFKVNHLFHNYIFLIASHIESKLNILFYF